MYYVFFSNEIVVAESSLDFLWKTLLDLVEDIESKKIYGYKSKKIYAYIETTIERSDVDFLNDAIVSIKETPEIGEYIITRIIFEGIYFM